MAFQIDIARPGAGAATRLRAEDGSYLIGRGAGCRIHLPDPDVSERHALLILRDGTATLQDLDSSNGTYVNDAPIDAPVTLAPNAVVQIGRALLRVVPTAPDAEAAAPADAPATPPPAAPEDEPPPAAAPSPLADLLR